MHIRQFILIVVILGILAGGVYMTAGSKSNKKAPVPSIAPTIQPTSMPVRKGSLTLRNPAGDAYQPGTTVTVSLYADSAGTNIVGYDAVVSYEPEVSEFKSASSLRSDFDVSAVTKGSQVYLTGTKKLSATDSSVLASDAMAELVFTVKAVGELPFRLVYAPGKTNTSNLITDTNENVLGHVEPETAYAGYMITLTKGVPVTLDGGVTVTLKDVQGIPSGCADCMETAELTVERAGETQEIKFRVGGIAGFMDVQGSAFGYTFMSGKFANGKMDVSYFRD